MNVRTLGSLEWDRVLALVSLCASTDEGKRRAGALLPQSDPQQVADRHARTEECRRGEALGGRLSLEGYRREPTRVPGGIAFPLETLRGLRSNLRVWTRARRWLEDPVSPKRVLLDHFPPPEKTAVLAGVLEKILDDRGEVADGASDRLRAIRRERERARGQVLERMQGLVDALGTSVLRDQSFTVRGGRLVLPVQASRKGEVKGILHDSSSSGATAFIEPMEVVELNNRLTSLDAEEREEVHRILVEVSARVSSASEDLEAAFDFIETLDADLACARFGARCSGLLPTLADDGRLRLESARHPLLDPSLNTLRAEAWGEDPRAPVVPLDLELSLEGVRTLVVSGPNAGGKSVTLKTVGLLCAMHQAGIPIPAGEGTRLPVFPLIHAMVGDAQSILDSLSTFSARMVDLRDALASVREPFLFILDELGSGTDPAEGAALGEAILLDLHARRGFTLCSTHYEGLKARALVTEGMGNAGMEFAEADLRPTFRLKMGEVGASRALAIAERSGLPRRILESARSLLPEGERHLREVLEALEGEGEALRAAREELGRRAAAVEAERRRQKEVLSAIEADKRAFLESLPAHLKEAEEGFLDDLKAEINRQTVRRVAARAVPRVVEAAAETVGLKTADLPVHILPKVGDFVAVHGLGVTGYVRTVDEGSGRLTLDCAGKTLSVGSSDVEVREAPAQAPGRRRGGVETPPADAGWEINLIGQTVDEAEAQLEPFMDRAVLAGLTQVRIIHGIGTGRLKTAVRQWARRHPQVASWEDAEPAGGGPGVTILTLRG